MGLIKFTNAPPSLSPFSMRDVEDHARQMLLKARAQAEQLLAAAQEEGEAIRKAAHVEGLAEGRKAGVIEGVAAGNAAGQQQALASHDQALKTLIQSLSNGMNELNASRAQLQEEAASAMVSLAVAIARKVVQLQGLRDETRALASVEAAARLVIESNDVRIAVHPTQRQTLTDALPALKLNWPALAHAELVDDATIAPGGCRIRTRGGLIDADLNTQIDRIAAELLPSRSTGVPPVSPA